MDELSRHLLTVFAALVFLSCGFRAARSNVLMSVIADFYGPSGFPPSNGLTVFSYLDGKAVVETASFHGHTFSSIESNQPVGSGGASSPFDSVIVKTAGSFYTSASDASPKTFTISASNSGAGYTLR